MRHLQPLAVDGGGCVAITASERASRCDVAAQVFAFLALWSWVLLIIFRLLVFLYVRQFPHHGYHVAACVSSIVPSLLVFQLLHLCSGGLREQRPGSLQLLFLSSGSSTSVNWFGSLWRLNPLHVSTSLLGEVVVSISGVCGRSVSAYVSGLFHETPWLLGITALLLCFSMFTICLFAAARYQLEVGLRGITVSRQWTPGGLLQSGSAVKGIIETQGSTVYNTKENLLS